MPAPRKPTALLEVSGAYKRNPARRRIGEPIPSGGIGNAPAGRSEAFVRAWDELVVSCCPGVLGSSDRQWLELTVELLLEFREAPRDMSAAKMRLLQSALVRLGMSPSDRSKVTVSEVEEEGPADKYF